MPANRMTIFDEKFNEYVYDLLSNATNEERSQLTAVELGYIDTESNLRKFINWGRWEKKLAILTKMNIGFGMQFFKIPGSLNKLSAEVYKQHRMKRWRPDNIEALRENGVFVVTNKEFALSMSILAQNCHTDVYFINPNYVKVSDSIKVSAKRKNASPVSPEYHKATDALNLLSKFGFDFLMIETFVRNNGLEPLDLRVLLWLFPRPNNFIHIEAIQRELQPYKPKTVAKICGQLWQNGYIDKLPTESAKPSYTITAKGVNFVGRVMQRVVDISTGR